MSRDPLHLFARDDDSPDERFYALPRLVTHIDSGAIAAVTQLYREFFPPGGAILDLMSSWVSHLPADVAYARVAGLGMNEEELAANPRLTERVVHNLNRVPAVPWGDASFDGAAICVSIQYLTQPVAVLRDLGRVLKAAAPLVITYSNRCFPTKAVSAWRALDDEGHGQLITRYLEDAGVWTAMSVLDRTAQHGRGDPLYAVIARSAPVHPSEKGAPALTRPERADQGGA